MVACQDEVNFKDAKKYMPERWLEQMQDPVNKTLPGNTIVHPFGNGKRICPGKKVIELTLTAILEKV